MGGSSLCFSGSWSAAANQAGYGSLVRSHAPLGRRCDLSMSCGDHSVQSVASRRAFVALTVASFLAAIPQVVRAQESTDGTLTVKEFLNMIKTPGAIERVEFKGTQYNRAYVYAGGKKLLLGEGYPKESPITPESPLAVQAKLRDAKIPFSVDFGLPPRGGKVQAQAQ
ncbi:hypothetical protein FVE85_0946 [Porphyridium purpureum]|uniref:Uncharacterized protein n=1 Tax=Porphyridium purpureum TaxID=35688 RepID=A0A5J4Z3K9_PORPP|nr:hypothetical protein FVE85_0946 [Porphyridium purpureum]|eukprot:POR2596..scf208_2